MNIKLNNFWLLKSKEKTIIKIVEWAQKNRIKIEALTNKAISTAIRNS
jgi:hypothetical protein